jgi:hypothetical protein
MDADRWQRSAPWIAAVATAATVLLVLLPAGSGRGPGPGPPPPVRPAPQALDRQDESLDRCAAALDAAGLAAGYPRRDGWQPLAQLFTGGTSVTLLDAEVPFVCATGPSTVEVSDPRAAVPVDRALLIASTPSGVLAAVAPSGARVEVSTDGDRPAGLAAHRHFLRLAPRPITRADQLAVTVGDSGGVRPLGAPERLAPPALSVVDRRFVPADPSAAAAEMLRRCLVAADATAPGWAPAQVLAYRRAGQPASLLVAAHHSAVGGCSVAAGEVTPLRTWGPSATGDARPFAWLSALPDLGADLAAGPVRPEVVRLEVVAGDGRRWRVAVAGGTFAGQGPPGAPTDPRSLTVRAYAADDTLLYEGPAAG